MRMITLCAFFIILMFVTIVFPSDALKTVVNDFFFKCATIS